jgi:hypothetical protein
MLQYIPNMKLVLYAVLYNPDILDTDAGKGGLVDAYAAAVSVAKRSIVNKNETIVRFGWQ